MNWRYILGVGIAGGLVIGTGRAVGLNHWFVFPAMAAVLVIAAAIIGSEGGKVGLNAFLTGCVIGLVQSLITILAISSTGRLAGLAHDFQEQTGVGFSVVMWLTALGTGLLWGVLLAIASWGASIIVERMVGKDTAEG